MTRDKILELLENNRNSYLSGEAIAEKLEISRAYVWKIITKLKNEGYKIEAVTNKGYFLSDETDIISISGVKKYLNSDLDLNFEIFQTVTSTNTILKEKANMGEKNNTIIISNEQTMGKGRKDRKFYSPNNKGIYFSILVRENLDRDNMITVITAVSVCQAIEKICGIQSKIKWVNDIYVESKKICGILTEASISMESGNIDYAIIGIGINLYKSKLPQEIENIAGFIFEESQNDMKNKLIAGILNSFYENYNKDVIDEYKKCSLVIGTDIKVLKYSEEINAEVLDIDENCALIVKYDDGSVEKLISGEISIKI